jgi:hypothetical protein
VLAGIDTDKHKYPIGSGRVTFNNPRSYMRAVAAAFIEIKTSKFTKKVQYFLFVAYIHNCQSWQLLNFFLLPALFIYVWCILSFSTRQSSQAINIVYFVTKSDIGWLLNKWLLKMLYNKKN